jgi:hypothetical protein
MRIPRRLRPSSRPRVHHRRPALEILEDRCLVSATFRSIDGSGNNQANTDWGSAGSQLLRAAPAAYADGVSAPAGVDRPSARLISNDLFAQPSSLINNRDMSDFVYVWGQFIDHDLDLTQPGTPAEPFNIPVPAGDPYFDPTGTGTQTIALNRSEYDPTTGTGPGNPRQQITEVTAFIDGSQVYGSDPVRAAALRTFVGGQLKTSPGNLLPYNTQGLPNEPDATSGYFLAGDVRVNENVELTALQTLFVREHNRVAAAIAAAHPGMSDEELYQLARRWVGAEIESITFNEFLPALLGPYAPGPYTGYDPTVNPGITTEFSTAAYRFGHSMLDDTVDRLDNNGLVIPQGNVPLANAFFNPALIVQTGIEPYLKGSASGDAQEVDLQLVGSIRNFLFGPPGAGGFDLGALDVQRGRDHGLADYNSTRVAYGLPPVNTFADITANVTVQQELANLYGNVNNIDLFVGGLAEDHAAGASVGPLFERIIVDQFQRLRSGDRFWFERTFSGHELAELEHTTLADVIRRNTSITDLQDNVFVYKSVLNGRVFVDLNGTGSWAPGDPGLAGWQVVIQDASGHVLDEAFTGPDGRYHFHDVEPGTYQVREEPLAGWQQTSANPADVQITRGAVISHLNFGNTLADVAWDAFASLEASGQDSLLAWPGGSHGRHTRG